jgi:indolepyruvate ferredoxin oxidoreductase
MIRTDVSLADRLDLTKSPVLVNGTQALVRLMLTQAARDRAAGWRTAGYVTGYRGSPLGGVDMAMTRAGALLRAADILFQPGLNEDLAATALWGTQAAQLRGEGTHEGVFGLWYGKGPGVDRSGDVLRHVNLAGTSPKGGVLMALGDDHTGESSTTLHQSDWSLVDLYIPVLSPAGVQEVIDLGLYGFALSRYAGTWAGLKMIKDVAEATSVIDGDPQRMRFAIPDLALPEGGLSIRLGDTPVAQEARMIDWKRRAAEAFARANRIDRRVHGRQGATIGLVAAGKSWLDLVQALGLLGLDAAALERLGITTYKVAQVWPMDFASFHDWAEGLNLVICVEEKRKLIEVQAKEAIFHDRRGRRVYGWRDDRGEELFPVRYALDPVQVALAIGRVLVEEGRETGEIKARLARLEAAKAAEAGADHAARPAYFCAGCPHNSSTQVPDGSRAYAGIGCHYLVQGMDRATEGFTQMGGEGANWIGEAPFSTRAHVFQNLGDGTYNHSGSLAIRAAIAAGVKITYKILFNDAVAMTGGQGNDGGLTADRIARELVAMGVRDLAVVFDPAEAPDRSRFPREARFHGRDALPTVQEEFSRIKAVSAILYIQTCAAEKRRRRKRGAFPDPDVRVFINPEVCEGCGDCGVQSNCVAILPLETPLGRKRQIDQSACNKDLSCLQGFCPSFVTLSGARPRRTPGPAPVAAGDLPEPELPALASVHATVLTGIGGTGVVTTGAILAMAGHLDGLGVGMIEMTGIAQKGGAVTIHLRLAPGPQDIAAIRVSAGEADCVIGGDLVVTAAAKTRATMDPGRTRAVINTEETPTGAFTRVVDFRIPSSTLLGDIEPRCKAVLRLSATELARRHLGDAIYANMVALGAAWQRGMVPVSRAAVEQAIRMNGQAVEGNLAAFALGRAAAAGRLADPPAPEAPDPVALRADHLRAYQGEALARRFLALVDAAPPDLRDSVARGYHKLLAVKDEYEVARLHLSTLDRARGTLDGDLRPTFHLAPPFLPGTDARGRPKKRAFGPWVIPVFRLLARFRGLRGTWADPFGRSAERRMERALIAEFEADMAELLPAVTPATLARVRELAELPLSIRGFGPVKAKAAATAAARRRALRAAILGDRGPRLAAE